MPKIYVVACRKNKKRAVITFKWFAAKNHKKACGFAEGCEDREAWERRAMFNMDIPSNDYRVEGRIEQLITEQIDRLDTVIFY